MGTLQPHSCCGGFYRGRPTNKRDEWALSTGIACVRLRCGWCSGYGVCCQSVLQVIRVFVDSVLNYGVPANFVTALIDCKAKDSKKVGRVASTNHANQRLIARSIARGLSAPWHDSIFVQLLVMRRVDSATRRTVSSEFVQFCPACSTVAHVATRAKLLNVCPLPESAVISPSCQVLDALDKQYKNLDAVGVGELAKGGAGNAAVEVSCLPLTARCFDCAQRCMQVSFVVSDRQSVVCWCVCVACVLVCRLWVGLRSTTHTSICRSPSMGERGSHAHRMTPPPQFCRGRSSPHGPAQGSVEWVPPIPALARARRATRPLRDAQCGWWCGCCACWDVRVQTHQSRRSSWAPQACSPDPKGPALLATTQKISPGACEAFGSGESALFFPFRGFRYPR